MNMLRGIDPNVDLVPLIIIFQGWHFNKFSIYLPVHLSSHQFVNEDVMAAGAESPAKST